MLKAAVPGARLLAEAIGCLVKGYIAQKTNRVNETAIEGLRRRSEHEVWKSHAPAAEHDPRCTIVIQRDPRDIAVSGHYLYTARPSISEMIDSLAEGKGPWLKPVYWTPYKQYYHDFRAQGFYVVWYRDLLDHSVKELEKMLRYLGIVPKRVKLKRAVRNQSFRIKKRWLLLTLHWKKYCYLRKGTYDQYNDEFSPEELAKADRLLTNELKR